ncbi:MAG: YDG domain-containing protein [Cyanobacteria bacterium]|nr:YDG domain-containing protein [Cyanobacteriota bacterium]
MIRISASNDALVAGQLKALGVAATASGTAASGQAGRGGRIEITGQRVALTGAVLDASGPAGGGTVLLGGDVRGANPALPNASSTTVDGASTVRADALAQGDGGTVVLWSEQQTSFAGTTSARGGPSGGDGGFLEVSSKGGVGFSGAVDAAAPAGKAGSVLFDPNNIIIDSSLQFNGDAYWDSAKGSVVLTPSAVNKSGSFFYDTAISLADDASFSTSFQFKISESKGHDGQDGADGLVFVIKNSNAKAIGDNGEGLGYKGISNSLGIEFDTYNNGIVAEAYKDSDGNHVGINLNGSIESKEATKIASNFNNALPWTAWVDYNDNLRSVDVRLANNSNSRPDSSVLSYILQKSLKDTIGEVNGSSLASFGFTAATGGATGKHEILSWSLFTPSSGSFSLNPSGDLLLQPAQIQTIANQGTNVVLQANNDITLKPNSSITIQSPTAGSGGISMQAGRSITLQSPITYVGEYSGPVNLIANDSSSFSNFRDIGAGNLTVDTGANLTSPHALVSLILGPGNNVYSPGVLQVKAPITASSVLARGASGISLSGGATLTASASSGKALTLDAGSGAFLNTSSAGAAALVKQPGATWAIYADNPTSTPPANLGGLPYNFKQYNQTFDTNQGSNPILGAGNGLFFANSPTLSVNLVPTPQVSKVYDGTNTANLVDSNYAVTGVSPGDSVNINKPTSGIYDNKNAAIGKLVSVSGLSIASATDATTAVPVYGYILGNSTANASIGTITKASAVVTANSGSTVYDSTLKSISGFSASGLVGGETIVDLPGVSAGASGRNAGSYTSTASGTAQNYSLSFVDGLFSITKAPLTISAATDSRVYNGTTSSSAAPTVTSGQVFSGDTLSGLSQVFDSKNVLGTNQSTLKVSVGYTLSDGNNGNNYAVSLATAPGTITPLPLPVTGLVANNKVYDATTVALLGGSAAVSPFSGDEVSVGVTAVGAFSDKNVGVDKEVTVTGVTISGADSGNYNLLQQSGLKADIFKANLAVSGLVANNKVYDATTVAPLGGSAAVRPLSGDEVSVGGTAVGAFAEKNVGGGNAVTVSGVTIAGRDAANYNLLQQTGLAATISKRDLMVAGLFANNKVYDATTVAPLGGSAAVSPFSGDVVTLGGTAAAAFSDKNVGMDKAVTVSGVTIAGRDAGNYNLLQQIGLKADISRAALSLTGLLALDKVYDATTVAPLGGSAAVSPLSGDVVTLGGTAVGSFADKNVAQAKTVSVSGLSLSGNDAGNYNLLPLTNLKAAITPATLQISASSDSKIYDGSTQSSLAPKITQGSLWGDDRLTGLAQTYESKNALGAGQSKLIVSAYTLTDGNNGGNYVLSFLPGLGTINRASVTPSFTVKSKPYDGNVAAEIAGNSLQGGLASDELFMVGASALFDNASAGNDKLVTITGYTLSGQDANNYQLSSPTATSTASITTQQDTDSSLPNDEPIKNEKANPTVGLQLSTISSATASKSVDVDSSNIMALPPGASTLESTPSGSTESQPTPSATAVSATSSVPNQTQPTASATASATAVTAGSATQEYQESDNRSAEDAKTSLGLSNAPTSEAMSAARLQLVMQSAASYIRKYPVRMLNQ